VGRIVSIDSGRREVVISDSVSGSRPPKRLESVSLFLDARTVLMRGKVPTTLDGLSPGDHAVARFIPTQTGLRALSIRVADLVKSAPPASANP
jgi:hypothetical protein